MGEPVDPMLAAAMDALIALMPEGAQDVVLDVRNDGRAEIGFVSASRAWMGPPLKFVRDDDGWRNVPSRAYGRNYSEPPNSSEEGDHG